MQLLAGMAKYAINQRGGVVNLPELASALGHRVAAIEFGLYALEAQGAITVSRIDRETLQIAPGGQANEQKQEQVARSLNSILAGTALFRGRWQRSPIADIIRDIRLNLS